MYVEFQILEMLRWVTGSPGPSGFGSASTAEQVTEGIDASNLTVLVTGGASGLGFETARVLALRNAHVIIADINMEAASDAKQIILKQNENARVDTLEINLYSLKSIKEFAERFYALNFPLNILINNAGIVFGPFQLSADGVEKQFATNYLGHFYLTNLLLDKMKDTANSTGIQGRIVNLASVGHRFTYYGGFKLDKINDKRSYSRILAYGKSKLALILHANELSRRLQAEGVNITANSVHPGMIITNIVNLGMFTRPLNLFSYYILKSVPQGAATTCYVALHPQLKDVTGRYFENCNKSKPNKLARDEELAKKLWDFSNNLIDSALPKSEETPL